MDVIGQAIAAGQPGSSRVPTRLAPGAQIVPAGPGWLVKVGSATSTVPFDGPLAVRERLLDALDGSKSMTAIARSTGVRREDLDGLVAQLSGLGVMDDGAPRQRVMKDRGSFLFPRSLRPAGSATGRRSVLVAGLGDLGLAVLRDLLASGTVQVHLFDPTPIQPTYVGPFYRADEVGQPRVEVVWRCLETRGRRLARRIGVDTRSRSRVSSTLERTVARIDVVVCCADQPTWMSAALADFCHTARVPLVSVDLTESSGRIAPIQWGRSANPADGCAICATQFRAQRDAFDAALPEYLDLRRPLPARWRHRHDKASISVVSKLTVLSVCKALEMRAGRRPADSRLVSVDFGRRTVTATTVPKHHGCRRCFPGPGRGMAALRRETERNWEESFGGAPRLSTDLSGLSQSIRPLVGGEYGIFDPPHHTSATDRQAIYRFYRKRGLDPRASALANGYRVVCSRPLIAGNRTEQSFSEGFDLYDRGAAEALALIEGLERLFALDYCEPRRVVHKRYSEVAGQALDPRRFPLFAEEQYRQPGFGYRQFHPDDLIPWIWGMELAGGEPRLVPRDFIYGSSAGTRIYRPTSNGAACHPSFHHAIVNGLYETVERDALMTVWLNRLSLPRVELDGRTAGTPARRELALISLECEYVDLTTDFEIPVMLGVLRDRANPDFYLLDMVASLDADRLLDKLHRELAQFTYPYLIDPAHYRRPVTDSMEADDVATFPDQLAFYQRRDKHPLAAFLTASPSTHAFGEGPFCAPFPDIRAEMRELVARLARRGHEVLVVDCTTPLLKSLGLHAVKVLVPGLQPLNAGHRYRVLGGRRALELPRLLGLATRDMTTSELNPWPHPFW